MKGSTTRVPAASRFPYALLREDAIWEREVEREMQTLFDPTKAPLFRVVLIHQAEKPLLFSSHITQSPMVCPWSPSSAPSSRLSPFNSPRHIHFRNLWMRLLVSRYTPCRIPASPSLTI